MYISLLSIRSLTPKIESGFFTDWGYLMSTNSVYVSLADPGQKTGVESELARLTKQHLGDGAKYYTFKLLPLKEQHFDARYAGKVQKSLLVTLAVIGLLIIIIASINYINITVASYRNRRLEIGTRKILGGSAGQLFLQLLMESLITSTIAVAIALIAVLLLLPSVNYLLFENDPVHILSVAQLTIFFMVMLFLMTIGTGIYPALMMSRLQIRSALRNSSWKMPAGISRKVLIVIQNQVAQTLMACTVIIVMQVTFLKNTDKGFDRKLVIMVPIGDVSASQKEQLRAAMAAMPQVQSFSFCNKPPSSDSKRGATVKFGDRAWEKWPALFAVGDSAYCHTFGIQMIAGRNIRAGTAVPEYLINETMAKMLQIKSFNDILGKNLTPGDVKGTIVGIVKDFNVRSLSDPIQPTVLLAEDDLQTSLAIKLSGPQITGTLNKLQKEYRRILPDEVFSYQFVDDEIAGLYKMQDLQEKLIWGAAGIAITISSLGLLGLISLITVQRTKEIGIRKVLGATVTNITAMLSKELLMLVCIAFITATPVAYWLMCLWLERFAFRISIQWWVFGIVGLMAVLITVITISFQSIKAAVANPVNSLRNE
jgi:putative ABC transport system permease protein